MDLAWPRRLLICLTATMMWIMAPSASARVQAQVQAKADVDTLLSNTLNDHGSIMLLIEPETGVILDANDAAGHFYGYSLQQLRQMHIQDINTLGADEVAAERRLAKAEKRSYFIFPHRLANGELRTVEVYSSPLHDSHGRMLLLSIIHDITGRVMADGELTAYHIRLEELLTRRTSEALEAQNRLRFWMILGLALQTVLIVALVIAVIRRHTAIKEVKHEAHTRRRTEEKLAIANADLQRFAEIAAHHLQEPTRRLMVFSQRLSKLLGSQHNENIAFSLATIEEQAGYLHSLVRDVQVYLAAASPLGPMVLTDPTRIIEQIRTDQRVRFAEHNTTFQIDPLPLMFIDTPRLRYLLTALIDNCVRHAKPEAPVHIHVSGEVMPGRSILRIADNGPGIPAEFRSRVLEVFEHLHVQADSKPGTGLGLAVVRRIIESCDGHILIEDSPLGGILVVLDLPGETP